MKSIRLKSFRRFHLDEFSPQYLDCLLNGRMTDDLFCARRFTGFAALSRCTPGSPGRFFYYNPLQPGAKESLGSILEFADKFRTIGALLKDVRDLQLERFPGSLDCAMRNFAPQNRIVVFEKGDERRPILDGFTEPMAGTED